jgi:hypothetical protein
MRCEGEDVPFYDSIDGMLVVFIMADPACYLVAVWFSDAMPVIVSSPMKRGHRECAIRNRSLCSPSKQQTFVPK